MSEENTKEKNLSNQIKSLIKEKPTTVTGTWKEVGEKFSVSRSTVDKELDILARMGEVNVEKPVPKSSKIYYRKDYQERDEE